MLGSSRSSPLNPNGGISNIFLTRLTPSVTSWWYGNMFNDESPMIVSSDDLLYLGWHSDDPLFSSDGRLNIIITSMFPSTMNQAWLISFGFLGDDTLDTMIVSNYLGWESLYIGGHSPMQGFSYGSVDVFLMWLDPISLEKLWLIHLGGSIHDYIMGGGVNNLDGSAYLFM